MQYINILLHLAQVCATYFYDTLKWRIAIFKRFCTGDCLFPQASQDNSASRKYFMANYQISPYYGVFFFLSFQWSDESSSDDVWDKWDSRACGECSQEGLTRRLPSCRPHQPCSCKCGLQASHYWPMVAQWFPPLAHDGPAGHPFMANAAAGQYLSVGI